MLLAVFMTLTVPEIPWTLCQPESAGRGQGISGLEAPIFTEDMNCDPQ
jgi:hypothetical protein